MTGIGAAFLAPERLAERGLTPRSIIYAPTGEEVESAARLNELRATDPGGLAIIRQLDDDDPNDQAVLPDGVRCAYPPSCPAGFPSPAGAR